MTVRASLLLAAIGGSLAAAPASAQGLRVTGLGGPSVTLTAGDIAAMVHVTLSVQFEGKTSTFQGVPLASILARVDAPSGKALRGKALGDVVIVSARDGYVVAVALAETDPMFRKDQIILADRAEGQPLAAASGPYRLVIEGDLRAARSARMVTSIAVRQLADAPLGR